MKKNFPCEVGQLWRIDSCKGSARGLPKIGESLWAIVLSVNPKQVDIHWVSYKRWSDRGCLGWSMYLGKADKIRNEYNGWGWFDDAVLAG